MELSEHKKSRCLKVGITISVFCLIAVIITLLQSLGLVSLAAETSVNTQFPQMTTSFWMQKFNKINTNEELETYLSANSAESCYLYLAKKNDNTALHPFDEMNFMGSYLPEGSNGRGSKLFCLDETWDTTKGTGTIETAGREKFGDDTTDEFYTLYLSSIPYLKKIGEKDTKESMLVKNSDGSYSLKPQNQSTVKRKFYAIMLRNKDQITNCCLNVVNDANFDIYEYLFVDVYDTDMVEADTHSEVYFSFYQGNNIYDNALKLPYSATYTQEQKQYINTYCALYDDKANSVHIYFRPTPYKYSSWNGSGYDTKLADEYNQIVIGGKKDNQQNVFQNFAIGEVGTTEICYFDISYNFYMWMGKAVEIKRGIDKDSYVASGQTLILGKNEDACIMDNATLVIRENATLVVKGNLMVYGKIKNYGTIVVEDGGSISCLYKFESNGGVIENYGASYLAKNPSAGYSSSTNNNAKAEGSVVILKGGKMKLPLSNICFYNYGGEFTNMGKLYITQSPSSSSAYFGYYATDGAVFRQYSNGDTCRIYTADKWKATLTTIGLRGGTVKNEGKDTLVY